MDTNVTMFLALLFSFAAISTLVTEAAKKVVTDKAHLSYNILAIVIAMIVGIGGTAVYYQLNGIAYTVNAIIYMGLMGFASALTSMVGYDKVKQVIMQLPKKD